MPRLLQIAGLLCAVAVIATWFSLGAHPGWTRTLVETRKVDPVTEIAYSEFAKGFVPGVDFLAAGLAGSAALFAAGFLLRRFTRKTSS
jgi:hypothetical protein